MSAALRAHVNGIVQPLNLMVEAARVAWLLGCRRQRAQAEAARAIELVGEQRSQRGACGRERGGEDAQQLLSGDQAPTLRQRIQPCTCTAPAQHQVQCAVLLNVVIAH